MNFLGFSVVACLMLAVAGCIHVNSENDKKEVKSRLSRSEAIQIARSEAEEFVILPEDKYIRVDEEDQYFIVTWEFPYDQYEGPVPGPAYIARVKIDSHSGDVVELLVGS